jgi:arylsulfatase A-like enzyme
VPTYEFNDEGDYSEQMLNPLTGKHSSELYADAGVAFLENYNSEKPFFMYMAFQAPHDPREMPQKYLDMYDTSEITLPPNFMSEHPFDNGLAVGQHGLMGKQNLYEHSINIPLIFKGPGISKGIKKNDFAYLFDIYSTLCHFAEIDSPDSVQGQILPVTNNTQVASRESLFFSYKNFQRAVRNDQWKLIKYNVDHEIVTQLFDLEKDPFETENLAYDKQYEEKLAEMTNLMVEQMTANNDEANLNKEGWGVPVLPAWKDKTDANEVEHLRKLAEKERQMRGFGF